MRLVQAIRVGDEWFGCEDETGDHLPEVITSEQCDNCGGNEFVQTQAITTPGDPPHSVFMCDACEWMPRMSYQRPEDICWPDGIDYSDN